MTAREDKELLVRVVSNLAGSQIEKHGGFRSFGATLAPERQVNILMPDSKFKSGVTPAELHEYWTNTLKKSVSGQQHCAAACWISDVRIAGEDGQPAPALFIHIEHANEGAEELTLTYATGDDSKLVYEEVVRNDAESVVFPHRS